MESSSENVFFESPPSAGLLNDPQWAPASVAREAVMRVTRTPFPSKPPMATGQTEASQRSIISRNLEDLLIREAHLRMSLAELAPAFAEQEVAEKEIRKARPMLLLFQPKGKRAAYNSQLAKVRETAQILRAGISQLNRLERAIQRMLRDEIEDLLRTGCPEYVQALAARKQNEDWKRSVNRFSQRVHNFLQVLGSARNMACTGYTRDPQVFSPAAVQGFVLAIQAAEQVESEVKCANGIADLQMRMFRDSGLEAPGLPRLPTPVFSHAMKRIGSGSLTGAQLLFDVIITEVRTLHEKSIHALVAQGASADLAHGSLIDDFLNLAWEQLREEVAPLVRPSETERSAVTTERMLVGRIV